MVGFRLLILHAVPTVKQRSFQLLHGDSSRVIKMMQGKVSSSKKGQINSTVILTSLQGRLYVVTLLPRLFGIRFEP